MFLSFRRNGLNNSEGTGINLGTKSRHEKTVLIVALEPVAKERAPYSLGHGGAGPREGAPLGGLKGERPVH